jgi:hypothetical protein
VLIGVHVDLPREEGSSWVHCFASVALPGFLEFDAWAGKGINKAVKSLSSSAGRIHVCPLIVD